MKTIEPQYATCFDAEPVVMGPAVSEAYRRDPQRFAFHFARYKFVARMLAGQHLVAEIGCGDAFASPVVAQSVKRLAIFDFDPAWGKPLHDIVKAPFPDNYDAIYMLDVIEHIKPADEPAAMSHIVSSLNFDGVFIAGAPTLEFQPHASSFSRAGHVNCKTGEKFKSDMQRYFRNVFYFGMSDEVVHTGFSKMNCYHFVMCCGPK
jgi:hypothetical protein